MSTELQLSFEETDEYDGRMHYTCPNECIKTWRTLVGEKRLKRAAAVCSGGEVGLFSILPRVSEELILVDHSIIPLTFAMFKALLIQSFGFDETLRLMEEATKYTPFRQGYVDPFAPYSSRRRVAETKDNHKTTRQPLIEALKSVRAYVPEKLLGVWDAYGSSYATTSYYYSGSYRVRDKNNPICTGETYFCQNTTQIAQYWREVSKKDRKLAEEKIGLVRFVHGSMTDLHDRGPFDLFYLSNAGEGGNGNRNTPDTSKITACVRPGGYIIATRFYGKTHGWKLLDKKSGRGWEQCVYQAPRTKPKVKETVGKAA